MTRPRLCPGCGLRPVARYWREYCYECKPSYRPGSPPCRRCGSTTDYYTAGLCRRCHRCGPWVDSCLDCLAWGVTRRGKWLCQACQNWRTWFGDPRECPSCRRTVPLNGRGYCRLCCRQATLVRAPHTSIDVCQANRHGQQLFLADLQRHKQTMPAEDHDPGVWPSHYPVAHRQLVLFDVVPDLSAAREARPEPPLADLTAAFDHAVADHARRHGWSRGTYFATRHALHILLTIQDTPGAAITATEAAVVRQWPSTTVQPVLDVLEATGMLDDDREPAVQTWFTRQIIDLPEAMTVEITDWFQAGHHGRTSPPRMRPRTSRTIRSHVGAVAPILRTWAGAGHTSLREITLHDITEALPDDAVQRWHAVVALRSLFRYLKTRGLIFANPTVRLRPVQPALRQPVPMDLAPVREALDSDQPARAALAALLAFHAPRIGQLPTLRVTDIHDGRLFLPDRTIPLAQPVQQRLATWHTHRTQRWPNTLNQHLFINHYTAIRTCPVSMVWINKTLGLPGKTIREDRILNEAIATDGDIRRLVDLFGLSVPSAARYTHTDNASSRTEANP